MKNLKIASVALLAAGFLGAGCTGGGDADNPISPEQMVEIRNKQMSGRENFKPDTKSPGAATTGGGSEGRPGGR